MGFLTQFEKISEKLVEGLFKGKFNGHVQPIEIAKRLGREMSTCKTISVDKIYVPNEYEVHLSPEDWQAIAAIEGKVAKELEAYLIKKAAEKKYYMLAKPKIYFQKDESLTDGNFQVACRLKEESNVLADDRPEQVQEEKPLENTQVFSSREEIRQLATQKKGAELVVIMGHDPGMTFRLLTGTSYIGRRGTNEVALEDANISRTHAEIQAKDGKYLLRDLDSTNGTYVNGKRIKQQELMSGDHIRVGTTELEFRVV